MSQIEIWFSESDSDSENEYEIIEIARRRRQIRDTSNPLELEESMFLKYFRLSKEAFSHLLIEIDSKLKPAIRSSSIPNILKLATALRLFAHGSYQVCVGNEFCLGLAQPTVSLVLKEVLLVLETHICPKWIKFYNSDADKNRAKIQFYEKSGIPGIIGCVDGTHIKISSPRKELQHAYYNRKGFYSINAMVVCDDIMRVRYINARYPGSAHDSFVFNMSDLKQILEEGHLNGVTNTWLLGDAGYVLKPYLLTPFRDPEAGSLELAFNKRHAKARNIVERTIGVLKSRWRCLLRARELHYNPKKATQITNVCAALHNICIARNVPLLEEVENDHIDDETSHNFLENISGTSNEGLTIRNNILRYINNTNP